MANRFGIYPVLLDDVNLTQVQSIEINPGIAHLIENSGGQVDPAFIAVSKASPGITITTTELKRVIDKVGTVVGGLSTVTGTDSPIIVYLQARPDKGERSSGNDFISLTIADALTTIRQVTANDGQAATITLDIIPINTAGTNPVVVAVGVTNPAITPATDQIWTAGPIKINTASVSSSLYTHVQSITVETGMEYDRVGGSGIVYDSFIGIKKRSPKIRVTCGDADALYRLSADGVMLGAAQGTNDSTVFLTRVLADGTRATNATASHVSFAVDAGRIIPARQSLSGQDAASTELEIVPVYDGTNLIIVVNTAVAIT